MNTHKPEVLAIIPARGGSKGLPRKNILDLCGKPLIAYTIEVALAAKLIDHVMVSTDDEEIAEISRDFGAEVPFLRPKEMAQDHSCVAEAINYTVTNLRRDGYSPNILVTLYPTHPFRTPALVDFLVGKALDGYNPVRTAKIVRHNDVSVFVRNEDNKIFPLLKHGNGTFHNKYFLRHYGLFIETHSGLDKPYLHIIDDAVSLIDIDTLPDFLLAEEVIKRGLFDFTCGERK